jgi:outer membrane protein insertion porin family
MLKFLNGFLKSSKLESIAILISLLIGLFCGFSTVAFAKADAEEISKENSARKILRIEIQGNKKIEKDAILLKIRTKAGELYDEKTIKDDIRTLFKMGFFKDIQIQRKKEGADWVLTYELTEKPSISEINYTSNSELKDDELAEASGIKPYEILNESKVKEAIEKLQKLYEDKGFFLARVESKIEDVTAPDNKTGDLAKLTFDIHENEKVKVKKITFLGNNHLKDGFLKSKMLTQEGGYFSFMSGSGAYKQEAFDRDVAALRFMYFNEGYIKVSIDRPQVYVTPDKKNIYISIRIEEGEQFAVGAIDFSGDILYPR